ncbi:hypothetical protein J7E73_23855 [Paenibacillus albidus]|nr:hypothetical protein [Paenibacillus albidus]MBT2292114.1 hypothetical protein [Paenibacillus albidus]
MTLVSVFWMVTVAAAAGIGSVKDGSVETIDGSVDNANKVICGNVVLQVHWQMKLVHGLLNVQRNRSFRKW